MLALLVLAQLALPDVLRSLGDEAERREKAGACDYHEVTVVEELGEDGAVKGSEERVYDGTLTGIEVTRREKTSVTANFPTVRTRRSPVCVAANWLMSELEKFVM